MPAGIGLKVKMKGMDDLLDRMERYPHKFRRLLRFHMNSALNVLHQEIPRYPPKRPRQKYRRGGTLGGSLGSSQQGGVVGRPNIKSVRIMGQRGAQGKFGSRLEYAQYVIGAFQAKTHRGRWWKLRDVAKGASKKIEKVFQIMAEEIARFLEHGT